MKRPRRWLFNGLAAMSLALFIATTTLWGRSYWRSDQIAWSRDALGDTQHVLINYSISSLRGGCSFYIQHNAALTNESIHDLQGYFLWHPHGLVFSSDPAQNLDASSHNPWRTTYLFMPTSPSPLGFQYASNHGRYKGNTWWSDALAVPYWLPASLFAIFPLCWATRHRKIRRRLHRNLCYACGYDLRATPDRCPECGTVPPKKEKILN